MPVQIGEDYLDSQNIQERIDELEDKPELDEEEETGLDKDVREELAMWKALKEETENCGWEYGIQFIREDKFEDYAQELAEDIGAVPREYTWPTSCIDWEQATKELSWDYTLTTIGDDDYYYREA